MKMSASSATWSKPKDIPDLDKVIKAIECDSYSPNICQNCPYNYQHWDDSGDNGFWWCNETQLMKDALFYLKLYQYLIEENARTSLTASSLY